MTDLDPVIVEKAVEALRRHGLAEVDGEGFIVNDAYAHGVVHVVLSAVADDLQQLSLSREAVRLAELSIYTAAHTGQTLQACQELIAHLANQHALDEAKADALEELRDYLAEDRRVWHGDRGVQVATDTSDPRTMIPLGEFLSARAAKLREAGR